MPEERQDCKSKHFACFDLLVILLLLLLVLLVLVSTLLFYTFVFCWQDLAPLAAVALAAAAARRQASDVAAAAAAAADAAPVANAARGLQSAAVTRKFGPAKTCRFLVDSC